MAEENIFDESGQSEWNSALATLQRINEIKKYLIVYTINPDPLPYLRHLKSFFKEIRTMMTPTEKKEYEPRWQKILSMEQMLLANPSEFNREDIIWLEQFELDLRDIEQAKNMNMPKKGDARFALARR